MPSQKNKPDDVTVESSHYYNASSSEARLMRSTYGKQGHICCHCCCDTRRATVVLNFIHLLLCFVAVFDSYLFSGGFVDMDSMFENSIVDDDYLEKDVRTILDDYAWALYTFYGLGMLFSILGIEGALSYRRWMVVLSALWYIVLGFASLFLFGLGGLGVILAGIWAYPMVIFLLECSEGIMTQQNYVNEIYSCCCTGVPHRRLTIRDAIENRLGVFSSDGNTLV